MMGIDIQSFSSRLDSGETTGKSALDLIGVEAAKITLLNGDGEDPTTADLSTQPPAATPPATAKADAVFFKVDNLPKVMRVFCLVLAAKPRQEFEI